MPDITIDRKTYIKIGNSDPLTTGIAEGTMLIDRVLFAQDFLFGQFASSMFEIQIYGIDNVAGQKIEVYQKENDIRTDLFVGQIESSKLDNAGYYRDIIAYDKLYFISKKNVADWFNVLWTNSTEISVLDAYKSLLAHFDIAYDPNTVTAANFSGTLHKDSVVSFEKISFKDMVKYLLEPLGLIPYINESGKGAVFSPSMANTVDLISKYDVNQSEFEEFTVKPMQWVGIQNIDSAILQQAEITGNTSDIRYDLAYNPIRLDLYVEDGETARTAVLTNFTNKANFTEYKPCEVFMIVSDMSIKLGDKITTTRGTSYVSEIVLSGPMLVEQQLISRGSQVQQEVEEEYDPVFAYLDNRITETADDLQQQLDDFEPSEEYLEKVGEFSDTIASGMGLQVITYKAQDGSLLKYFYAPPPANSAVTGISGSNFIFTMKSSGFAWTNKWEGAADASSESHVDPATGDTVSTQWTSGISKDGNALLKVLNAYKVSADILEGGTLQIKDAAGNVVHSFTNGSNAPMDIGGGYLNGGMSYDTDNGLRIASSVTIGGSATIGDTITNAVDDAVADLDLRGIDHQTVEYAVGDSETKIPQVGAVSSQTYYYGTSSSVAPAVYRSGSTSWKVGVGTTNTETTTRFTSTYKYLWACTVYTFSNGTTQTYPLQQGQLIQTYGDGTTIDYSTFKIEPWQSEIPTVPLGYYLWTRKTTYYTDDPNNARGTATVEYSVTQKTGVSGGQNYYAIGTSPTSYANADLIVLSGTSTRWVGSVPDTSPYRNKETQYYLWTRKTFNYAKEDGAAGVTASYMYTVQAITSDGAQGDDGVGIIDEEIKYAVSNDGENAPTTESSWKSTIPSASPGQYLWTRIKFFYSNGTDKASYTVARQGSNGTGATVSSVKYAKNQNQSTQPNDSSFNFTMPTLDSGDWLWVKTTYSDGSTAITKTLMGSDGRDGDSVVITTEPYHDAANGVTKLVITDSEGEHEISIPDGLDGDEGSHVHFAWCDKIPASGEANIDSNYNGFTTNNLYSSNKKYIGVCANGEDGDPTSATAYSWTLIKGSNGTSVTVSKIEYGTSDAASTAPSSYSTTVPTSLTKGKWLWTRTTYSNSSTAITKTYIGTDGKDGDSVIIQSATKTGKTTRLVVTDGTTTKTLEIVDGQDGDTGTHIHFAWADNIEFDQDTPGTFDHSGFTTNNQDSTNKLYIGVCADAGTEDPQDPGEYSWTLVKGTDGQDGSQVTDKRVEYAISDSGTEAPTDSSSTSKTETWYLASSTTVSSLNNYKTPSAWKTAYNGGITPDIYYCIGGVYWDSRYKYLYSFDRTDYADGTYSLDNLRLIGEFGGSSTNVIEEKTFYGLSSNTDPSSTFNNASLWSSYYNKKQTGSVAITAAYDRLTNVPWDNTNKYLFTLKRTTRANGTATISNLQLVGTYGSGSSSTVLATDKWYYASSSSTASAASTINSNWFGTQYENHGVHWQDTNWGWNGSSYSSSSNPYLYQLTRTVYQNGSSAISNVNLVATYGTSYPPIESDTSWQATPPDVAEHKGKYLWTRSTVTYSNGVDVVTYSVAYIAIDGVSGTAGRGISSITTYYKASSSGSSRPTSGWQTTASSAGFSASNRYLWTYAVTNYTDGTSSGSADNAYVLGVWGQDGSGGGSDGRGISKITPQYALSASNSTAPTSGWSDTVPEYPASDAGMPKTSSGTTQNNNKYNSSLANFKLKSSLTYNVNITFSSNVTSTVYVNLVNSSNQTLYSWQLQSGNRVLERTFTPSTNSSGCAILIYTSVEQDFTISIDTPRQYYWQRDKIEWTDGSSPSYTKAVLSSGINAAIFAANRLNPCFAEVYLDGLDQVYMDAGHIYANSLTAYNVTAYEALIKHLMAHQVDVDGDININSPELDTSGVTVSNDDIAIELYGKYYSQLSNVEKNIVQLRVVYRKVELAALEQSKLKVTDNENWTTVVTPSGLYSSNQGETKASRYGYDAEIYGDLTVHGTIYESGKTGYKNLTSYYNGAYCVSDTISFSKKYTTVPSVQLTTESIYPTFAVVESVSSTNFTYRIFTTRNSTDATANLHYLVIP